MSAPPPHLGRVFVSSVFGGMMNLRALAGDTARRLGFQVDLTEEHIAQPASVQSRLGDAIAGCDIYVGLFDKRRGTVPPSGTADNRAITEEELRIARERGLRCLVFISKGKGKREPQLQEFLDREVSDYESGVWPRPYSSKKDLRRAIAAGLAALRPRVVLQLRPGAEGLEAVLYLKDVQPAWPGEAVLGPVPVSLGLDAGARRVFEAFLEGPPKRSHLPDEAVQLAGAALAAAALPGLLGEALSGILDLAARDNALLVLEVRTEDAVALALPWELLSLPRHPLPVKQGLVEVVRRIGSGDPARDIASTVPAEHLSVLGFTASPIEDQEQTIRLGAQGGYVPDTDLFWEREQERLLVALDRLLRDRRGRLILPDTGDKETLRQLLAREDRPQVVHISCHGGMKDGKPVLLLEDSEGHRAPVGAEELLGWVRVPGAAPLDLLVLSACSTAGSGSSPAPGLRAAVAEAPSVAAGRAPGMTEALVRGGLGRVLGMQGPVSDPGATAFAEKFYAALGQGTDLPQALRLGRAALTAGDHPHEWAVPTLTVQRDAGPLVAPESGEAPVATPFEAVRKEFQVEGVAYLEEGYVGRRDFERMLRTAFDRGERLMVIHGLGGIGKSTLAARFLERRRADGARVLYAGRELAPATLLNEVASRLGVTRPDGLPPEVAEEQFRKALSQVLREVVPTLLYLDNFEDQQSEEDGRLRHPELGEALVELLHLGGPGFRMLITSRLALALDAGTLTPWNRDLGELSASGCRKLRLLHSEGLGQLDDAAWRQVMHHLGGHPKALELLNGYLKGQPDRARTLLQSFGEAVDTVDRQLQAEQQERGRKLLVDAVLAEVPEERRPAFDRLCLLDLSFPAQELEALLEAEGLGNPARDLAWLRDHGLLARKVSPGALEGGDAVHRLLASRQQNALVEREGEEAARAWHLRVAEHLVQRPGSLSDFGAAARHRDLAGDRAGALALYLRWALKLRNRFAYAACEQVARGGLEAFPVGDPEAGRVAAASLWMMIHDAAAPLGRTLEANAALKKASDLLEGATSTEARFHRAGVAWKSGQHLLTAGDPGSAEREFTSALEDWTLDDHPGEYALALGEIALLRARAGDDEAALRILHEALKVYEQIGDVRERAITLGAIARLRAQAGDVATARELAQEKLDVVRALKDIDGVADGLYFLSTLDLIDGRADAAIARLTEAWEIVRRIGQAQGMGLVGALYGQLLIPTDRPQAISILQTSREAFRKLGRTADVSQLDELLKRLAGDQPDEAEENPPP